MDSMDSTAFGQMIFKLGLVTQGQIAEVREEIGEAPELQHLIAALERKGYMTPWQRGKVLKGDLDGFILGGYKLLYKIQSGSFGRVYRAVDPRDGRVVAVKVLRRRWSENEQRIEMFIREGKVGLMLKHPNIVEVLAINRDPASVQYYIVMEFVEGGNLREILQIQPGRKMSVGQSLRIIEDCANGLAYAYSRGMTHRDIKLTNILISDTGDAKLVDFGLAQFFSTAARTEEEKVDRTVDYAGLERATEVKQGDIRSDIYFLGTVLYECLTGRPPLTMTRDKHARMRKGRFEEVRPIHPNEADVPPSVLMLVETLMALDPRERYQTPSQLLDAVRRVRREVEGKSANGDDKPPTRSVFLAEPDERLQEVLRDGLKNQGYRVFLAGDPLRALDRFHKQPYDGLIVDARTTGEEGIRVFESVVDEASRRRLRCAGLLLLDEEQADRAARMPSGPHIAVLVENESEPITYRSMSRTLKELMESAHESKVLPALIRPAPLPPPSSPPKPAPRIVEEPPPMPVSRVVEVAPKRAPRVAETPPTKSTPRVVEAPPPREEVVPPKPRREPIAPAAFSPPPPIEVSAPPAFMGFSVLTDDSLTFSEDEDTTTTPPRDEPEELDDFSSPLAPSDSATPPQDEPEALDDFSSLPPRRETATPPPSSEPMIPVAQSSAPPREEVESPPSPHGEQMDEDLSPPPLREEAAPPPPPRREPATVSAPPSFSRPAEDDLPMLAIEERMVLPPPEESIPERQNRAAGSKRRREETGSTPQRLEKVVPSPRRAEPRKKREPQSVMQHITHEDPLSAPDTHDWRDELGVPEKEEKEEGKFRLWAYWESLTPKQKSISGLGLLALVVGLFLLYMISDMLIYRHFDKIQEGMSVQEVEAIMGGPGEKLNLNPEHKGRDQDVIKPETIRWEKGNKIIMVTFSNGRVLEGGKQILEN